MAKKLADFISKKSFIDAGSLGLYVIPNVLAKYGYNDVILDYLRSTEDGYFGGWIKNHGATTAFNLLRHS